MLTEHVLVQEGNRVRFFHESFFDYAFARCFFRNRGELVPFLEAGEQHLFRRGQVRQILAFLRDHDSARYHQQLREFLSAPGVRFHLKRLAFAWLGALPNPRPEEWAILNALLRDDRLRNHILTQFHESPPWFDTLDGEGVIAEWLASPDEALVNRGLWLVTARRVWQERSERVAALLRPYRGHGEEWDARLRRCFYFGRPDYSRPMQEFYLDLLRDGLFDDSSDDEGDWWAHLDHARDAEPAFIREAIAVWLDRRIDCRPETIGRDFLDANRFRQTPERVLAEVARRDPQGFVETVLPRVLEIIRLSPQLPGAGLTRDVVWGSRRNAEPMGASEALLVELTESLEWLARENPDEFVAQTSDRWATESDTVAFLMLRAWSANPAHFSSECVQFLFEDPRRLDVGYGSWSGHGTGHAATSREAIVACRPYADVGEMRRLETAILGFSALEDGEEFNSWHQRLLLEAVGGREPVAPRA